MLKTGIIRPSKPPYCKPTFCVKKTVGWRTVHDFRGINSKFHVPSTPVPRKEVVFDTMADDYSFSAMDLLCDFFHVRLPDSKKFSTIMHQAGEMHILRKRDNLSRCFLWLRRDSHGPEQNSSHSSLTTTLHTAAATVGATRGRAKNGELSLTPQQLRLFTELKRLLSDPPTLAHPDRLRPFYVLMDASDYAVGGYLYQVDDSGK
ncbi:hypothetical protein PHMEG_0002524 [Phytophthora megakarya]|uniref:Reverse transcriptase/retrotransposon-derived protein RNase H-like domain-containing protein n=1 Tax=Phytophthora megakarya TaxID=4795 RepID=A0A225X0G5_9STRA|nr:hypothetical protein PHMEG_0002524 [Phytophthora megakarya]